MTTTGFPAARADAVSPPATENARGKLLAPNTATGPIGRSIELIIPTDAQSPGAKAAKVAAFIDARLDEEFDEKDRTDWRTGLTLVDRLANDAHGRPFVRLSAADRTAILTRMAQNEANPQKPEEVFFKDLKARVAFAYYTSEIGIKQDMEYKGNTYLQEFVGYDVSSTERKSPA